MRATMIKFASVFLVGLGLAQLTAGCSAADSVKDHFSCQDVCQTYDDCFHPAGFSVDDCKNKCEDKAVGNDKQQDELDECHSCIDDKSCVADVATCSGSCSNFVP